jgi:uncharacterized protein (TIGR02145 family)
VVIEDITILYDSVYLPQLEEWYVYEFGADTTFSFTCAPSCGDPVSYQGYDYATVLIGEQCWFAENLRSENYENGDEIPSNLSNSEWESASSGAVKVYDVEGYGRLYNGFTVDDSRGLCPSGWHVPSDSEWMTLEMALGMSSSEASGTAFRGTDQGTQMKTTYGWNQGGNGTNSSGFSALPGGFCYVNGSIQDTGSDGYWWSSSSNGSSAWYRALLYEWDSVFRNYYPKTGGYSVRCIKDSEE